MSGEFLNMSRPIRLYRNYQVDQTTIDLLAIYDGPISAYMACEGREELRSCLARVPVYDEVAECVELISPDLDEKQLAYFPLDWGVVHDGRIEDLSREPEIRNVEGKKRSETADSG